MISPHISPQGGVGSAQGPNRSKASKVSRGCQGSQVSCLGSKYCVGDGGPRGPVGEVASCRYRRLDELRCPLDVNLLTWQWVSTSLHEELMLVLLLSHLQLQHDSLELLLVLHLLPLLLQQLQISSTKLLLLLLLHSPIE